PSCHKRWVQLFAGNDPALPPDENASGTVPVGLFMRTSALGRFEVLGQGALGLRDFAAQGTNPRPRHGTACHAVPLRQSNVLVMFLSIPEDGPRVKGACKELIPPYPYHGSRPSQAGQRNAIWPVKGQGTMARTYPTRAWHDQLSPSLEEIELMALEAYANLPEEFRKLTGDIVIQVSEFPTEE